MKNNGKHQDTERTDKPFLSEPVISRTGKIKRVELTTETKRKSARRSDKNAGLTPRDGGKKGEVTISDAEFFRVDAKKTRNERSVHTIRSKVRNPFPVVTVLACLICSALFMSLIFNLVRINEYTKEVSGMRSEVTELTKQKNELAAALDEKNNVENLKKYIAEHAESMGMVEEGKMNPPVAVTPEKSEKVEDYEVKEESDAVITTVLNALARNFYEVIGVFTGSEE